MTMQLKGPNFILAGSMRCGTTSLYRYLDSHPEVFMTRPKEPHFFAHTAEAPTYTGPGDDELNSTALTDWNDYLSLFANGQDCAVRGEASTHYLYSPTAATNMATLAPEAEVAIVLRDPVARAYSSYQFQRTRGREPINSFAQALDAENWRIENNWQPIWHYRSAGMYAEQVDRMMRTVGRDKVTVVLYEDLRTQGLAVLREPLARLGIPPETLEGHNTVHNRSGTPKHPTLERLLRPSPWKRRLKAALPRPLHTVADRGLRRLNRWRSEQFVPYTDLDPLIAEKLRRSYRADLQKLEALIDRDLSAWRGSE